MNGRPDRTLGGDAVMSCLTETEAAIAAAQSATEAVAELLRFAREGAVP
jgi:hypothetical protein